MNMEMLDTLKGHFCDVLCDYAERGIRTAGDVETAKNALSAMVKIHCLENENRRNEVVSYRRHNEIMEKMQDIVDGASDEEKRTIREMLSKI